MVQLKSNMKILVAEDDLVTQKKLKILLTNWRFNVITVTNGNAALTLLESNDPPKIAILDWMMPGKSGVEICRRIRKIKTENPPFLILLTAKSKVKDLVHALESGADDYITKPFGINQLKSRIDLGKRIIDLQYKLEKPVAVAEPEEEIVHTEKPKTGRRDSHVSFIRHSPTRSRSMRFKKNQQSSEKKAEKCPVSHYNITSLHDWRFSSTKEHYTAEISLIGDNILRFTCKGKLTENDIKWHVDTGNKIINKYFDSDKKVFFLLDLKKVKMFTSGVKKAFTAWLRNNLDKIHYIVVIGGPSGLKFKIKTGTMFSSNFENIAYNKNYRQAIHFILDKQKQYPSISEKRVVHEENAEETILDKEEIPQEEKVESPKTNVEEHPTDETESVDYNLNEKITDLVAHLGKMSLMDDFSQHIPSLAKDDPMSNLYKAVASIQHTLSSKEKQQVSLKSELKKVSLDLKNAKSQAENILEIPPDVAIFALDKNYNYLFYNENHKRAMKNNWNTVIDIGSNMLNLMGHPEEEAKMKANFDRAFHGDNFTVMDKFGHPPHQFVFDTHYFPLKDGDGNITGVSVFLQEFTDEKMHEKELELERNHLREIVEEYNESLIHADEEFKSIFDSFTDVYYKTDRKMCFTAVSPSVRKYGYEPKELIGEKAQSFYHETAGKDNLLKYLNKAGKVKDFEFKLKDKAGNLHYMIANVHLLKNAIGKIDGVEGILRDVTKEKEAEIFRSVLHNLSTSLTHPLSYHEIAMIVADKSKLIFDHDAFSLDLIDHENETLVGIYNEDTEKGEDNPKEVPSSSTPLDEVKNTEVLEGQVLLINRTERPKKFHLKYFGADRASRSLMFVPIMEEAVVEGILSVQSYEEHKYSKNDLINLKLFADHLSGALLRAKQEKIMRENDKNYHLIFDSSNDAIMLSAPPYNSFYHCNPAALTFFGFSTMDELCNKTYLDLSPEFQLDEKPSKEKAKEMFNIAIEDGAHQFDWTYTNASGEELSASTLLTKIIIDGKDILQVSIRAFSDIQQAEYYLRETELFHLREYFEKTADQDEEIERLKDVIAELEGEVN